MAARGAQLGRLALLTLLAIGMSCIPPGEVDQALRASPVLAAEIPLERVSRPDDDAESAVVLVVLDGARWQDVFVGADAQLAAEARVPEASARELMPHLHALIAERGAALGAPGHGPPISASGPNFVSLPGYTEIFGGRRVTGCADNDCGPPRDATVMDELAARGAAPGDAAVIASWERIERAATVDPSRIVVSAGRSHLSHVEVLGADDVGRDLLDRGAHAEAFPGYGDFRPDRLTAAIALHYLETRQPRLMFLGLGEPDEYAHRGDYAGYLGSLRASDAILGDLFTVLDRMGARGRHTTVLVTADHGRARDYRFHGREFPESARVWLVAAGGAIQARGLAQSLRPHRLADVAPTVRALLDLPADVSPVSGKPIDELLTPAAALTAMQP
jgi:hypothetical protein